MKHWETGDKPNKPKDAVQLKLEKQVRNLMVLSGLKTLSWHEVCKATSYCGRRRARMYHTEYHMSLLCISVRCVIVARAWSVSV